MYLATAYQTDVGAVLTYAVSIYIGSDSGLPYQQEQVIGNPFVPSILLPNLVWFSRNPCPTQQVVARYVILRLISGDILQIAYPFLPGTANYSTFWKQLQVPEIISVEGIGEKCNDKMLRNFLGVT